MSDFQEGNQLRDLQSAIRQVEQDLAVCQREIISAEENVLKANGEMRTYWISK